MIPSPNGVTIKSGCAYLPSIVRDYPLSGPLSSALPRVRFRRGEVVIAGAGPGDWSHVTLRALSYLTRADVVVYDRLTDHSLFRFAPKGAELIDVGKSRSRHVRQEEINRILLEEARRGKRVLRWKGGDPFVYGRGYEEYRHLRAHGVPVTVVPGVSSVTSLPLLAGIPILSRGTARTLGLFTGETRSEFSPHGPRLDWLAASSDTLIGVMVVKNLDRILHEIGRVRGPEEPAALIVAGATQRQRVIRSTISQLGREVRRRKVVPPALLVVGPVVGLE